MKRDPRAFLSDVIEAGEAILQAVNGLGLEEYCQRRLNRSSVEREFTIIGEALTQLSQRDQELFAQIDEAQQIIAFRNKLAHEYIKINHSLVWGVINTDLPVLIRRCSVLLQKLGRGLA